MVIRLTESRLDLWRKQWPCSTLTTGWVEFDSAGDLVDMGGRIAKADVDGHELDAYADDHGRKR